MAEKKLKWILALYDAEEREAVKNFLSDAEDDGCVTIQDVMDKIYEAESDNNDTE